MQHALGRASACAAACLLAACMFPLSDSAYYTNAVTATTGVISTGDYSLHVEAVLNGDTLTVTNQNPQYACKLYVLEGGSFRSFGEVEYQVLPIGELITISNITSSATFYAATSYQTLTPDSVQGTLGNNMIQVVPNTPTPPEPLLLAAEEEGSDTPVPETVIDPDTQPPEETPAASPEPPAAESAANEAEAPAEENTAAPEEAPIPAEENTAVTEDVPAVEENTVEPPAMQDTPPEETPNEETSSA